MIDQLLHRITLRQVEIQKSTAEGIPLTWESYQRMVGNHQGLQDVVDMINNMMEEEEGRT